MVGGLSIIVGLYEGLRGIVAQDLRFTALRLCAGEG